MGRPRRWRVLGAALLALAAWVGLAQAEPVATIRDTGSSTNRVDVVILGDGYTAAQQPKFASDAAAFAQALFAEEPFREYEQYFNVRRVEVVSAQSGADHSNRTPAVFVNTALDAEFNCLGIQRLICVNTTKVNDVLSRSVTATSRDVVVVLVNDPEYGGSGGALAVASLHALSGEIVIHELGHSFGLLADEYGGPPPPACQSSVEPAAVNVTLQTVRQSIKWAGWIAASTPIPTSAPSTALPGLYEGAAYCDVGVYRPTHNSKMRNVSMAFEQINSEQLVRRVYNLVSPIDAVSPLPTTFTALGGEQRWFSVATPSPRTHALTFAWTINGQPRGSGSSFTFDTRGLAPGTYAVQVQVSDPTSFVRSDPGGALRDTATWNVNLIVIDTDGDGLPDFWEQQLGLDPSSATGDNGGSGNPDGDARTNLEEFHDGTHPRGFFTRYFAEGATSGFFDASLALLNPSPTTAARVWLRFQKSDGSTITYGVTIGAFTRATVRVKDVPGMATAEFSTVVESDQAVVADRTMTWDTTGYGSHAETSVAGPATTWYLAEGATHAGFDLFYLIQNANAQEARVHVSYLLPSGPPIEKDYIVASGSRFNIWVDVDDPRLATTEVSAVITSDLPIIVERAMYLSTSGQTFVAGHESAGVTTAATEWFLAEGATGPYFDLFVLVANPSGTDAQVQATFLLPSGPALVKTYTIAAHSRFNIWVDVADAALADTAVSTLVTSINGVPIVVERAMWWPGPNATAWAEAHNSAGLTSLGRKWALAEGEVGGARGAETYILIANRGAADTATVTLLYEDGASASKVFTLPAGSRTDVAVAADFPSAAGKRFGAIIEAAGPSAQIAVERAMYTNAGGSVWAAGTNAVATKLQ